MSGRAEIARLFCPNSYPRTTLGTYNGLLRACVGDGAIVIWPVGMVSSGKKGNSMSKWRFWGKRTPVQRRGVLTLEWILLISVVVIGIIAGLGAVRDAILCELQSLADAVMALNVGS